MARSFLIIGALSGLLTVMLGAFGAHGLEGQLTAQQMSWWQKAVTYQQFHSLALLLTGLLALQRPHSALTWAGWLFSCGIVLFSGSLYLLALGGLHALGMVTPIGGLCFITGWAALAWAVHQLS